ncbi:MAG: flagellar motor switch protein FliN [Chitinispirillales bacterium]|nr:flagellar motor switch protein FliN [Chitinispirillales bacterium]
MSDHLSQDEIDSLLSAMAEGGDISTSSAAPAASAADSGASDRLSVLTPFFELFCTHAGDVVTSVVTKKVVFSPDLCTKADMGAVGQKVTGGSLLLKLSFTSGLIGDMFLIMNQKYSAILSDLMMMGDGSAPYNEEHKDAIGELLNNVVGSFKTAFGAEIKEQLSAANVEVTDFDAKSPPIDTKSMDMGLAKLSVEGMGDSYVALLISNELANAIAEKKSPAAAFTESTNGGFGISQAEMDALTNLSTSSLGSGSDSGGFGGSGGDSSYSSGSETYGSGAFMAPGATAGGYNGPKENIDLLLDVELDINIELGRSDLSIKKILELAPGSIVELDKMAGEPVDLLVNNKVVAKGEVVVIDENFGIRIVSLIPAEDRIKSLR